MSSILPVNISQSGSHALKVEWKDGHESIYQVRDLRLKCRCAHCVDEWNGTVKIDKSAILEDVKPVTIEGVGRYGIKINWSDGHNSGIFSYDYLRTLCGCEICKGKEQ